MQKTRRRAGSLVLGLVVATSLFVTACGSSPATLNAEKVERAIEQSILAQRGKSTRVSCPSAIEQRKGLEFACRATVGGQRASVTVIQTDESGGIHYEARRTPSNGSEPSPCRFAGAGRCSSPRASS